MILTEKEAERMTCCGPPGITMYKEGISPTCSASTCMAWRWAFDADGHYSMKQVAPPSECPDCEGKGFFIDPVNDGLPGCSTCDGEGKISHYEQRGFCGLAGKPE